MSTRDGRESRMPGWRNASFYQCWSNLALIQKFTCLRPRLEGKLTEELVLAYLEYQYTILFSSLAGYKEKVKVNGFSTKLYYQGIIYKHALTSLAIFHQDG
jgi:hypothetical protein